MSSTGYTSERAYTHDLVIEDLVAILHDRGYQPKSLERDGNRPDLAITDRDGRPAYVDLKTCQPHQPQFSLKSGSLLEYWRITLGERRAVYIVWSSGWEVDTPFSLTPRIIGGPRRNSGTGSLTDWYLVARGGTPLNDFFVPIGE